jgi:ABC-type sulfate transport system permease subunit
MNRHDYAVLTLRIFALYVWFSAVQYLLTYGAYLLASLSGTSLRQFSSSPTGLGLLIVPVVDFWIGLFLFMRSRQLAAHFLPEGAEEAAAGNSPMNALSAASIAFAVAGIYFFFNAVWSVVNSWVVMAASASATEQATALHSYMPRMVAAVLQGLLGLFLFLKARALASIWWRKQQPKPPAMPPA